MATSPYDDTVFALDLIGHLIYGKPASAGGGFFAGAIWAAVSA